MRVNILDPCIRS